MDYPTDIHNPPSANWLISVNRNNVPVLDGWWPVGKPPLKHTKRPSKHHRKNHNANELSHESIIHMAKQESDSVILGRLDERVGNIHERIERIDKTLHENGLIVQVDRNTQWRKSWRRHITTAIGFLLLIAAIAAIIVQNWKE